VATGGDDGVIKLWNVATLREVAILHQHRQPVRFLAFAAEKESTLLVSRSGEQVHLWRAASWREIQARMRQER